MHASRVVVVSLVTFVLGLLAGLGFALYKHKQDEAFILTLLESRQVDIPHDIALQLKTISAAQTGDIAWIIRSNCVRTRSKTSLINTNIFSGAKRADVTELIGRASSKVQELEQSGLCSMYGLRSNNSFKGKPLRGSP
jgi:hypothetical protein